MNIAEQLLTEHQLTFDDIVKMKLKHIEIFDEEPSVLILPSNKPTVSIYGMIIRHDNVSMPQTEGDRSKLSHQEFKNENR
jgi:hypothetical protein